ncbi:DUF3293 domain-containing protein [Gallaecimonas kandeliae]|uniref:DUF3293 domain-containing protein n=1 Tax=Gallaecimonas kandeliae TaxID=3029055 RepID=UPI0026480701|nr:DUF3293 domain-containing protein [Gallaecimonas kandeliae]WKE64827.1 DUF3293 domain-containing protein [Gallaecimonas kandeliae]
MELWDAYQNTVFLMQRPPSRRLSFAIVTAYNPRGKALCEAANHYRDQRLEAELKATGQHPQPLWGCSPDFQHREKSWALVMPKEQAVQLGWRLEQNAIYYVEHDVLYLVPCLMEDQEESRLGLFSERLFEQAPPELG